MIKNFERNMPNSDSVIDLESLNLGNKHNDPFNSE